MKQTIEQLIKLQEIDMRLLEIKEQMGDLPITVESQELEISDFQTKNEKMKQQIIEIEKELRRHEAEIKDFTNKLEKYKEQLFLVKSNKEYDAINQEIDHMKSTISTSEDIQLKFEQEKIDLEDSIKLNTNNIESISKLLISNRADLENALAETTNEQSQLEINRSDIHKQIEEKLLNTYETMRNARDGVGMASLIGMACGGCYSQLPPQTVIEIKENNKIITCPSCGVLQFWDGAEE